MTLPALRHLGLNYAFEYGRIAPTTRAGLEKIGPQLESLSISLNDWKRLPLNFIGSMKGRALVSCIMHEYAWPTYPDVPIENLRFCDVDVLYLTEGQMGKLEADFDAFGSHIQSTDALALKSIYLDPELLRQGFPCLQDEFERLSLACEARKIEIVWEDGPSNEMIDSCMSTEFNRRQHERAKSVTLDEATLGKV